MAGSRKAGTIAPRSSPETNAGTNMTRNPVFANFEKSLQQNKLSRGQDFCRAPDGIDCSPF